MTTFEAALTLAAYIAPFVIALAGWLYRLAVSKLPKEQQIVLEKQGAFIESLAKHGVQFAQQISKHNQMSQEEKRKAAEQAIYDLAGQFKRPDLAPVAVRVLTESKVWEMNNSPQAPIPPASPGTSMQFR